MTDKPLSAAAGPSTAAPSLAYMAPAWFAVVMGWSGLAGAWLRAEFLLGEEARALGTLGAVLAALVFMALGLASLRRLRAHPAAVRADMLHPVRHAFMATLPLFWSLPTSFLAGTGAAAGIALINSLGNLSGFVSPYAIGWLKAATGTTDAGIYLLSAAMVIAALLTLSVPKRLVNR